MLLLPIIIIIIIIVIIIIIIIVIIVIIINLIQLAFRSSTRKSMYYNQYLKIMLIIYHFSNNHNLSHSLSYSHNKNILGVWPVSAAHLLALDTNFGFQHSDPSQCNKYSHLYLAMSEFGRTPYDYVSWLRQ